MPKSAQIDSPVNEVWIETADGWFEATFSGRGLAKLRFPPFGRIGPAAEPISAQQPPVATEWLALTRGSLDRALAGHEIEALPPLDLTRGTPFQRRVWGLLREIACGETRSYGEIAQSLGLSGAARAVGAACGANPIPVIIPCHRVLAARGRLGGFSAGLEWKRLLLSREGTNSAGSPVLPFEDSNPGRARLPGDRTAKD